MCTLDLPTYPNLVREFYGSAKIQVNPFETEFKGVRINLTIKKLGQLLRAPIVGAEKPDDHAEGLHLLFDRDDALEFEEILGKHLSTEHRLLHHMVSKIFIPRTDRFDYLNKNDVGILYYILKRE